MDRATNLLGIKGRLGGVVLYKLDGKYVARTVGVVEKERYAKGPEFQKMRENMFEFGGASVVGKALRQGLMPYARDWGDSYVSGRLNGVMKRVISLDSGTRGCRAFRIRAHGAMLEGFQFNKLYGFRRVFYPRLVVVKPYYLSDHSKFNFF